MNLKINSKDKKTKEQNATEKPKEGIKTLTLTGRLFGTFSQLIQYLRFFLNE